MGNVEEKLSEKTDLTTNIRKAIARSMPKLKKEKNTSLEDRRNQKKSPSVEHNNQLAFERAETVQRRLNVPRLFEFSRCRSI